MEGKRDYWYNTTKMLRSAIILAGLLTWTKALAQAPLIPESGTIGNCSFITGEFHFECFPLYLAYLIRFFFGFAGGFALTEIIRGGYEYALSGVQATGVDKESAKKRITHAILGLSVTVLTYLIIDTIVSAVFYGS